MQSITLTVQQVENAVSHLSDEDRARVIYNGVDALLVPDDLAAAVSVYAAQTTAPAALAQYAAAVRYAKETGGITVNGTPIPTDRQTQAQLTGAYNYCQVTPSASIQWKLADGSFVTLNASAITAIATAVAAHVQDCFAKEATVKTGIDGGTITTTAAIDAAFA